MTKLKKAKRPSPLSLWLSHEERATLEAKADGMALGAFIKAKVFGEPVQRGRRQLPVRDQRTIAQLLACLGASGLAAHLRELADAARSGSLACDDEIARLLTSACADITAMRAMLVMALGLKAPTPPPAPPSTPRQAFDPAAARDAVR